MNGRGWLRISSTAQYLDVSVRTVRRLLRVGLPHVRIPGTGTILIKPRDIDQWLMRGKREREAADEDLARDIMTSWAGIGEERVRRQADHGR
jgi:excisionase family DNA binding protein